MPALTYKKSGVDIDKANLFVGKLRKIIKSTKRKGVLGQIGSFGGFFDISRGYKNPILVSSSDGVGTKLKIAFLANKHDTVGIDLVAMNVDDCLCSGAEPLFFLDYIAIGKINQPVLVDVVKGIARGCRSAGCALLGGETAEMPDFYKAGEYDLSGFCVGIVEKGQIIDGSRIRTGDKVIGLVSSGLHSNGYSLVRKLFSKKELKVRSKEFLKPTRIYTKPVLSLLKNKDYRTSLTGIIHITGGGFIDNIPRVIPRGMSVEVYKDSWQVPAIFLEIEKRAGLDIYQMFRTFNMGVGMVLIVRKNKVEEIVGYLKKRFRLTSWVIGEVVKGSRKEKIVIQ
ncbi:MAG: phosphoribosylformylglycinamidine cyclo-ligase [Candidatus Omnitrophota bacterium]|nr:phosphoribosylformylglycinamidine cyclo-ligase [Candidatus Omnitrophota bacterium]